MDKMLRAALALHDAGCAVVPVVAAKRPAVPWKRWTEMRQRRQHVCDMWQRHPGADIAIVLGAPSQMVVLDIERRALGEIESLLLPRTPLSESRSGGRHFYFEYDAALRTRAWSLGALHVGELRSDDSLIMTPPSTGYRWLIDPSHVALAEPPLHLLREIDADACVVESTTSPTQRVGASQSLTRGDSSLGGATRSDDDFRVARLLAVQGAGLDSIVAELLGREKASEMSARAALKYAERTATRAMESTVGRIADAIVSRTRIYADEWVIDVNIVSGRFAGRSAHARSRQDSEQPSQLQSVLESFGVSLRSLRPSTKLRALLAERHGTLFVDALVPSVSAIRQKFSWRPRANAQPHADAE